MAFKNKKTIYRNLGLIDYKKAWDYQTEIFNNIIEKKIKNRKVSEEERAETENYLLFCQHPHVYTLGKSGKSEHLLITPEFLKAKNATYYHINRGGDITYHGPGQIVGYPILDLDNFFTDIHKYLRLMEEAVILTLAEYGVSSGRVEGLTGVWIDGENPAKARKICAMGVKSSRWVTMHGFAFNVYPDLEYFNYIVPCGISDKKVTSLAQEINRIPDIKETEDILLDKFTQLFEMEIVKEVQ
ncbi:lipoyl(octanoyl) transferase LipB [Cytophagaceae bacterium ABcell3]|nr:lipoyl(octanoyl) transferase LipB [Cytophagaceae bacterium ABcell3]